MFLFLSKLLPLFIYPLGLSCLLLFIALVMAWKYPRRAAIPTGLALIILLLASNGWIEKLVIKSLEWENLAPTELPTAEAIVILGGGVRSVSSPRPFVEVNEAGDRVIYGAKLYRDGKAPLVVTSGGRVDWRGGGDQAESTDMATLLELFGVPKTAILEDKTSLNTYENAVNIQKILAEKKISQVLLVTSAMHMKRSLLIFQKLGMKVIPAPTDFLVTEQDLQEPSSSWEAIALNLLPDSDRLQDLTRAIKEYLGISIYRLRGYL